MKSSQQLSPLFIMLLCSTATADVTTDGSMGAVQHLSGNMTIPQNLGTTVGANLFHSFKTFNINTGESATFTGDNQLKNVISRVTGGDISHINGVLKSDIGSANFYFINPAGVFFGNGAVVDVPAAFHVSTGDKLNFKDGSAFYASLSAASQLNIAEPSGFDFLTNHAGDITLQNSALDFDNHSDVSLSAGNIVIDNGKLTNASGAITINATDSLALKRNGLMQTTANTANAGNITVTVPNVTINNADISSRADAPATGKTGLIAVNSDKLRISNDGRIISRAYGLGDGQGIEVDVKTLKIIGGDDRYATGILSYSYASDGVNAGNASDITVKSDKVAVNTGAIASIAYSTGEAGSIDIEAKELSNNYGVISSQANGSTGNANTVALNSDNITVENGGEVSSVTFGDGDAGQVNVQAKNLQIIGANTGDITTGILGETSGRGNGATITITSDKLIIKQSGQINASTYSDGNAGNVAINAKTLAITGFGSNKQTLATGILSNAGDGAYFTGNAGTISINSDDLTIKAIGQISSSTYGDGNAGTVAVNTNTLAIDENKNNRVHGGIFTAAWPASSGKAGTVNAHANTIDVAHGVILASAEQNSSGRTGNIDVTADKSIYLYNAGRISVENNAKLANAIAARTPAGSVNITAPDITLAQGGTITAASFRNIDAGQVTLSAPHQLTVVGNDSVISTQANAGNGGKLTIKDSGLITLQDNTYIKTYTDSGKKGGDIDVTAEVLLINTANIKAQADNAKNGGDVNLTLNAVIPSQNQLQVDGKPFAGSEPNGRYDNVIQSARAGGVKLNTPQLNLSGSITALNRNMLNLPDLNRDECNSAALRSSSLARASKGGLPRTEAQFVFIPPITTQVKAAITPNAITAPAEENIPCAPLSL